VRSGKGPTVICSASRRARFGSCTL
jgi:hypothetical protein